MISVGVALDETKRTSLLYRSYNEVVKTRQDSVFACSSFACLDPSHGKQRCSELHREGYTLKLQALKGDSFSQVSQATDTFALLRILMSNKVLYMNNLALVLNKSIYSASRISKTRQ